MLETSQRGTPERAASDRNPVAPDSPQRIAIIGAGMAGMSCATELQARGCTVTLFDKGRRPGGRMATRHVEGIGQFDTGAQYFTVRGEGFKERLKPIARMGGLARWEAAGKARGSLRYVAVPEMNALAAAFAHGLDIRRSVRIEELDHGEDGNWHLVPREGERLGPFEAVIVALPAPQAASLLQASTAMAAAAEGAVINPSWATMLAFSEPLKLPFEIALPQTGPLTWIARDSSKPGRPVHHECWVLHGGPGWSQAHIEEEPRAVADAMLRAFESAIGRTVTPVHLDAHRWRHALVETPLGRPFLYDPELRLGACGDWCLGPRVEFAHDSGVAIAEAVLKGAKKI